MSTGFPYGISFLSSKGLYQGRQSRNTLSIRAINSVDYSQVTRQEILRLFFACIQKCRGLAKSHSRPSTAGRGRHHQDRSSRPFFLLGLSSCRGLWITASTDGIRQSNGHWQHWVPFFSMAPS